MTDIEDALMALMAYQQADEEGVMVLVSRQAIHEVHDEYRRLSAERASVLEECAKIAEEQARQFLSPEYASNQPFGSTCERFACGEVAKAIRELIPVSVGGAPDSPDSSGVRALDGDMKC